MKRTYVIGVVIALFLFTQCAESDSDTDAGSKKPADVETDTVGVDNVEDSIDRVKFDELFANVPSPYVMTRMLKQSGTKVAPDILHNTDETANYFTERDRALNMGIYAVDLTYSHVLNLSSNEIQYMAAVLTLARQLGIDKVFKEDMLEQMRNNIDNKEVVLNIITETYGELEYYLKEEGRQEIAAYMMTGGVVEIIFLGTHVAKENDVLKQAMADQSIGINAIIGIIKRLGPSTENEEVLRDLEAIMAIFDRMEVQGERPTVVNKENGDVVISSTPAKILTPQLYSELKDLIGEIRSNYIQK